MSIRSLRIKLVASGKAKSGAAKAASRSRKMRALRKRLAALAARHSPQPPNPTTRGAQMLRRLMLAIVALMLVLAPGAQPQAQEQQGLGPAALDQPLLDRWLAAMPPLIRLGRSDLAPQDDEQASPQVARICSDAGFASYEQCAETIGYVGMIVGACDRGSGTFRDPIALMRRQLARIEAKTQPSAADQEQASAMRAIIAAFPDGVPQAHLQLMSANRERIFAALSAAGR